MVRASSVLASASLAAMASAAPAETTSTVTLMLPMLADNTIWASVVTAKPDATQYFIACPSGQDSNDCGLGAGFTVMNGPSTMSISMPMDVLTAAFSCKLDSTAAVCTGQMTDNEAKTTSTFDSTITGSLYSTLFVPVTITAGLEKLAAATGSTGSGVSTPTATGTGASSSATGGSGSSSASAGTSSSTAGVPRITGNVVVMGAAALVGGAAMLL